MVESSFCKYLGINLPSHFLHVCKENLIDQFIDFVVHNAKLGYPDVKGDGD